ncbi:MAG: cytochrome c biogenesis protein ResB [Isosphaeraceae bacterium]|nr:cytochrome c biogenesis protein ResB [Isosphaeraceae bacterium]
MRACDATYRFLASLKLAVITLTALAATLAFATFFESWYGSGAVQEYIYRSAWYQILLAFLATNILCAALIRIPWSRRQTGFVITHTGLLVVLAGSFISYRFGDEGQVGMVEGGEASELVRVDHPVIRVQKLDPQTGAPIRAFQYPFYPGAFAWSEHRVEELTDDSDPFRIKVSRHIPASSPPFTVGEAAPDGMPMIKAALLTKPPGAPAATNVFGRGGWIVISNDRLYRAVKEAGPARVAFQYVKGDHLAEKVDDFLHLPREGSQDDIARFHYEDQAGQTRSYDWVLDPKQEGRSVVLPESDLTVTFTKTIAIPLDDMDPHGRLGHAAGGDALHAAQFKVRKGNSPAVDHYAWSSLPMIPNVLPNAGGGQALVRISFLHYPELSATSMQGPKGVIEILGTPDGRLYYRAFGSNGLRGARPIAKGETIPVFGGEKMPMQVAFRVEEFYTSGRTYQKCEPIELAKKDLGNGIPACQVEMTVEGETRRFWIRRSPMNLETDFQTIEFPSGVYRIAYDVDRKPLHFSMKLTDFDVGNDPGTMNPASYTSQVLLTDEEKGLKDQPVTITMNEPLTHRGWTFYQSNYIPIEDPATGDPSGQFMSVFQVHYDPAWKIVYSGCLLVVLGTFVQFYMRAGIFTDGGKREHARAEARARAKAAKEAKRAAADAPPAADEVSDFEPL